MIGLSNRIFARKLDFIVLVILFTLAHFYFYFGSIIIYAIVLGFFGFIISYFIFKKEIWSFLILMLIGNHFFFSQAFGHYYVVLSFFVIAIFLITKNVRISNFSKFISKDIFTIGLLYVFIISNISGWIFHFNSIKSVMLSLISFFSFILTFIILTKQRITVNYFRTFIIIIGYGTIVMLLVSLNQKFGFILLRSPVLGNYMDIQFEKGNIVSTLWNSEAYGEYAALVFCSYFTLLMNRKVTKQLNISSFFLILVLFVNIANSFLSYSRSSLLLLIVGSFLVIVINYKNKQVINQGIFIAGFAILLIFFVSSSLFNLFNANLLLDRFDEYANRKVTVKSVLNGEDINRFQRISFALTRLQNESFIIGSGFRMSGDREEFLSGFVENTNKDAQYIGRFHNLYLQLPILYGWLGATSFLLLLIVLFIRLIKLRKESHNNSFAFFQCNMLIVFWFLFLINQYKIDMIRFDNYHMMFWFWLGFSYAIYYTIKFDAIYLKK
jgi:O-antigen ligase